MWFPGAAGRGGKNEVFVFNGRQVSILQDEKVPEMSAGGDGYTTACVNLMPQSCVQKNGRDGKFYVMGSFSKIKLISKSLF